MIKKTIVTAAVILTAVLGISAQNKSGGINLSVWDKVCTQPLDSAQTTYFNLGIATRMNRLNGVGLNILAGATQENMNGVQISGIANAAGGNMRGVQLAGITNVNGGTMNGVSISGLVNVSGDASRGVLITGLANIAGENSTGLMVSGLSNIAGENGSGVLITGLSNIAGNSYNGLMIGGLANISGETMNGLQIAGLANIAGEQMSGAQIALANVTGRGKGLQIGLFNFYSDDFQGLQLGLINANPSTRYQLMVYGGNSTKLNVGLRAKNDLFYTVVGVGGYYLDFDDKFSGGWFYRAGLELPLYKKLFVSGDLGFQHIELFKNKDEGYPRRLYALEARLNLEYRFTEKFGLFATGGYSKSWDYSSGHNFRNKVIVEAGTVITLSKPKK